MTFFELTDDLPAASVAVPFLKARQRELLLDIGEECTLGEVAQFLETGAGHPDLTDGFNTPVRRAQLKQSMDWFDRVGKAWVGKQRRDPRFNWVVPRNSTGRRIDQIMANGVDRKVRRLERLSDTPGPSSISDLHDLRVLKRMRKVLLAGESVNTWLRFLSVEGANVIEKMRSADRTLLMTMMAKGSRRLLATSCHGPWEPTFPRAYRALPISWLYQFEPSPRAIAVTNDLLRVGCSNVGHLFVLSPGAWSILKATKSSDWLLFRKTLHGV